MNSRVIIILLFILLLISLIINGILGTVLYSNIKRLNHTMHFYAQRQEGSWDGRFGPGRDADPQITALRDSFMATKRDLMAELAKDPLDEAKVRAIIEKSVSAQGKMEKALGTKLLEQRKTMGAEEAKEHFSQPPEDTYPNYYRRHRP